MPGAATGAAAATVRPAPVCAAQASTAALAAANSSGPVPIRRRMQTW